MDVPPYFLYAGLYSTPTGLNRVGFEEAAEIWLLQHVEQQLAARAGERRHGVRARERGAVDVRRRQQLGKHRERCVEIDGDGAIVHDAAYIDLVYDSRRPESFLATPGAIEASTSASAPWS